MGEQGHELLQRSEPDSRTNPTSNCFKYRSPPWISFVDLLLVPEAKSFFSIKHTFNPLDAASNTIPASSNTPSNNDQIKSCGLDRIKLLLAI